MGIIARALSNYGSNFHQIIMDTISTPLASLGSVVGWAYVIFVPLLWFFGIHGSLALTALDSGIMTPRALENISVTSSMAPSMRRWKPVKRSISGRNRCWILISSSVVAAQRWV